jgi:hypothetical protein
MNYTNTFGLDIELSVHIFIIVMCNHVLVFF